MANAKNTKNHKSTKNTVKNTKSAGLHTERPANQRSRTLASRRQASRISAASRRIILVVIVMVALLVILTVLFAIVATPEHTVKSKIESISRDYYENYFYDQALSTTSADPATVMQPYTKRGFARVSLRQLLSFDSQRHGDASALLTKYCDPERTYVTFYPDTPFNKTDYHAEYNYSCNF